MLAALGLEEGTEQTKPMVEEYAAWLQTVYFDGVTEAEDGEALRGFSTCTPESSPQGPHHKICNPHRNLIVTDRSVSERVCGFILKMMNFVLTMMGICWASGRQLNRHVSELVETQEFAMKAQELTGGLGGQGSGVAS